MAEPKKTEPDDAVEVVTRWGLLALAADFRNSGDFDWLAINLQVPYWIERSGGRLFRKTEEIRF